jgi:hypothetical protein
VIDRAWNVIWGGRDFRDLGKMSDSIGRGLPTDSDLRILRAMSRDPRFELVFWNPAGMQAVFMRKGIPPSKQ